METHKVKQPTYYANIPAPVRYDNRLKANSKLLYGEITCLTNKLGYCFATNQYFAELYGVSKNTISIWINDLVKTGHIISTIIRTERNQVKERRISLSQNNEGGIPKNNEENITSNNIKINNNTIIERRLKFEETVHQATDISVDTLDEFCDYWCEQNQSGTKMKFEMERTFDINLRLKRWCRNNKKWNQKPFQNSATSKIESAINTHQKAREMINNINNSNI